MSNQDNECKDEDDFLDEDEVALLARNLSKYFRASRNERKFSHRPNSNQNRGGPSNPKGNQPFKK